MKKLLLIFVIAFAGCTKNQTSTTGKSGIITTFVGNGFGAGLGFGRCSGDGGPATAAELSSPYGVVFDNIGNIYIADCYNNRIRKVSIITGNISTIAGTVAGNGNGGYSGDGGSAIVAKLNSPYGVAVDGNGSIYIADANARIRKIEPSGNISTIAGNGMRGFSGDGGPATAAQLSGSYGIAVDEGSNLFISDWGNNRIRKVNTAGIITTIAGGNTSQIYQPRGIAVDKEGNVYIAEDHGYVVLKLNTSGIISVVAGTGTAGYSGDGGAATSAKLCFPFGVAVDNHGNIFIADAGNNVVRKVNSLGIISTVAGSGFGAGTNTIPANGGGGYSGDGGQATSAKFWGPNSVAVDGSGNLFISDGGNNVIRRVSK